MPTYRPFHLLSSPPVLLALLSALPAMPIRAAAQTAPAGAIPAAYLPWTGSADLVLNTSSTGSFMAATVRDIPVLVRLRAPDFPFAEAVGRGRDIRFTNAAGDSLPFEIESWDSAGAKADIWVLADTVRADNATQFLRMYWGNPAAAAASRPGAVFAASRGLEAVWHLGGAATAPRPNAVTGGHPAQPMNYSGGESVPGIIGLADSLDGVGKYLDVGDGYADYPSGFTYSAWVKPSSVKAWGRLLDFGNGQESDNIILGRDAATNNLAIHVYPGVGIAHSRLNTGAYFRLGEWHHVAVAIRPDDSVLAYLDGLKVWSGILSAPMRDVERTSNWLGRSHWATDAYWHGLYDEVRIERTARDSAWLRLSYLSQRPGANLIAFRRPTGCASSFVLPSDTTVAEGSVVALSAKAACATHVRWAVTSGLSVPLADPSSATLYFTAPRVVADTQMTLSFTATFDSARTGRVVVRVKEAIPEPRFNLPDSLAFGSADSLTLVPAFTNLAAVQASPRPEIRLVWTLQGQTLDTLQRGNSLVLRRPDRSGVTSVGLCADNGGPPTCKTAKVAAGGAVAVRPRAAPAPRRDPAGSRTGRRRLDGRLSEQPARQPLFAAPAKPSP